MLTVAAFHFLLWKKLSWSSRVVFGFCFLLWVTFCIPSLSSAQQAKPAVQDWQVRGAMAALHDSISEVRIRAAKKLIELERADSLKSFIPVLIQYFTSGDAYIRSASQNVLGELFKHPSLAPEVLKHLVGFLESPDESIKIAAVSVLGNQTRLAPELIKHLVGFLESPNKSIKSAAITALGNQTSLAPEVVKQLVELVKSTDEDTQRAAIYALRTQTSLVPEVLKHFVGFLESPDENIKRTAIYALRDQTSLAPELIKYLTELVKSTDEDTQRVAIYALRTQTSLAPEVLKHLVGFLESPNENIKNAAITALGNQTSLAPEVVKQLVELVKSTDEDTQQAAIYALRTQTSSVPEVLKHFVGFLESPDENIKGAAIYALGDQTRLAPELIKHLVEFLESPNKSIKRAAIYALGNQTSLAPEVLKHFVGFLESPDENIKRAAITALGNQTSLAPEVVKHLVKLLKSTNENNEDIGIQEDAIAAIGKHPLSIDIISHIISHFLFKLYLNAATIVEHRFLAHYTGAGDAQVETLLKWIGKPESNRPDPKELSLQQQQDALSVFTLAWPATETLGEVRSDLAFQIAEVTEAIDPEEGKALLTILQNHHLNLQKAGFNSNAANVSRKIDEINAKDTLYQWFRSIALVLLCHLLFWAVLIGIYPANTWVQSIFFWNPWVRKVGGWGYVQPLLTRVPFLQRRLLLPFRETLLEDARLMSFQEDSYFAESEVTNKRNGETTPLLPTLSAARGIVVLEGESGLGKTMYLRYLAKHNPRISAFVLASQCKEGVIKALAEKLLGMAGDEAFLNSLLYNGAVSLYLDGVNEVGPDTREKIGSFLSQYNKAHCVVTTQPIHWDVPERVPVYKLLPLKREKIKAFLTKRAKAFDFSMVAFSQETYWQRCEDFLSASLDGQRLLKEELQLNQKVLSNPMDLTIVGQMLFNERVPNLMNLQSEYYSLMAETYQAHHGAAFPLAQFSEYVYSMRLKDKDFLPVNDYHREVASMLEHKMVVLPVQKVNDKEVAEWRFRHDKIREFFITRTFRAHPERITEHFKDPRFRGVYFMLASVLPAGEAARLREDLLRYAVENSDHLLSDEVLRLLWTREELEKNQKAPEKQEGVPADLSKG